jgi:hypothetical protein
MDLDSSPGFGSPMKKKMDLDPDPGGSKTCGSGGFGFGSGSGFATLVDTILRLLNEVFVLKKSKPQKVRKSQVLFPNLLIKRQRFFHGLEGSIIFLTVWV